jgi:hypothetical protein
MVVLLSKTTDGTDPRQTWSCSGVPVAVATMSVCAIVLTTLSLDFLASRPESGSLDLSQYTGSRLKRALRVLDFVDGRFVARSHRKKVAPQIGRTARDLISILRGASTLQLTTFQDLVAVLNEDERGES